MGANDEFLLSGNKDSFVMDKMCFPLQKVLVEIKHSQYHKGIAIDVGRVLFCLLSFLEPFLEPCKTRLGKASSSGTVPERFENGPKNCAGRTQPGGTESARFGRPVNQGSNAESKCGVGHESRDHPVWSAMNQGSSSSKCGVDEKSGFMFLVRRRQVLA